MPINTATTLTIKWKINAVFFLGKLTFKLISRFKYFTYISIRMTANVDASIFINEFF